MKKRIVIFILTFCWTYTRADFWTQKASYPGLGQELPLSFSIGNKGYVGGGTGASDFWEYDPAINTWTQQASIPGGIRRAGVGFSINGFGYAGTGDGPQSDFYEYDPGVNIWTAKTSISIARSFATGFSIGNKGYIGCGQSPFMNDFWEFDPALNTWTQKSSLPAVRSHSVGFSINGKGYMTTGFDVNIIALSDIWEYDPLLNTWTQKTSLPTAGRTDATGFVICDKGYVMSGGEFPYFNDLWQYNPILDQWLQKAVIPTGTRDDGTAFTIGSKGYFGLGQINGSFNTNDFWEYTPDSCSLNPQPVVSLSSSDTVFCEKQCINFFDLSTNNPTNWYWYFPNATPDTSTLQNPANICYNAYGTYDVRLVTCNAGGCDSLILPGFITVYQTAPPPVITQHTDTLFCSTAYSYAWYESMNPSTLLSTDSFLVCLQNGNYFVIISDSNGCEVASSIILVNTGISDSHIGNSDLVQLIINSSSGSVQCIFRSPGSRNCVQIYNTPGMKIGEVETSNAYLYIDLSSHANGIYFLKIISGKNTTCKKIWVAR